MGVTWAGNPEVSGEGEPLSKEQKEQKEQEREQLIEEAHERLNSVKEGINQVEGDIIDLQKKMEEGSVSDEEYSEALGNMRTQLSNMKNSYKLAVSILEKF